MWAEFVSNNTNIEKQKDGIIDIVIQIEVKKKEELNSNILNNKHEPDLDTIINSPIKYLENAKFKKILNTPIYYGDIENMNM